MFRFNAKLASAMLLIGLVGCMGSKKITLSELPDRAAVERRAKDFWQAGAIPTSGKSDPKVAIAEFSIEYMHRSDVDVSNSIRLELPSILYKVFAETITEFSGQPVELNAVRDSKAYQRLEGVSYTDAGVAMAMADWATTNLWYPAEGLLVVVDGQNDEQTIMKDLLEETGADVALKVRLKVGHDEGHAFLCKGSTFKVFTADSNGLMTSRLDLFSDDETIDEETIHQAGLTAVESRELSSEAHKLFSKYIAMALVASGSAAGK